MNPLNLDAFDRALRSRGTGDATLEQLAGLAPGRIRDLRRGTGELLAIEQQRLSRLLRVPVETLFPPAGKVRR